MTDNEIIKALECCLVQEDCTGCPLCDEVDCCEHYMLKQAFDFIKQQQAEIETLKEQFNNLSQNYDALYKCYVSQTNQEVLRQREEIERLKRLLERAEKDQITLSKQCYKEAIKEFAERFKNSLKGYGGFYCRTTMNVRIDNLVKEMVGEE